MNESWRIFVRLVALDLRLAFRRALYRRDGRCRSGALAALVAALLFFHLLFWPLAGGLSAVAAQNGGAGAVPWILAALAFVAPWLLAQSVSGVARAICDGDGLGSTLAAPVSARSVIAARCVSIAIEGALSLAVLIGPFTDTLAWRSGARWLAVYPTLFATSLTAVAVGLVVAHALLALLGPRRTRLAAQFASAGLGASFVLLVQAAAFAPSRFRPTFALPALSSLASAGPTNHILSLPARAAAGSLVALALWCAISVIVFATLVFATAPALAAFAVTSAGVSRSPSRKRIGRRSAFGTSAAHAVATKEWRLLIRDPWTLSQIFLQIVYAAPIGFALYQSPGLHASIGLAVSPTVVVIACQLAASLAWLAVSAEDAPDLLASAPLARGAIDRLKLRAIAIPLSVLFAPVILTLLAFDPHAALLTLCFSTAAGASSALLNFWSPGAGRRKNLMRRHAQSKLIGLQEHILSIAWATAACLALIGSFAALAPMALAAAILYANRRA